MSDLFLIYASVIIHVNKLPSFSFQTNVIMIVAVVMKYLWVNQRRFMIAAVAMKFVVSSAAYMSSMFQRAEAFWTTADVDA